MATLTSTGIGSGLDVSSIVSSLVASEQDPYETRITAKEEIATEKITSLGSLVSAAAAFEDAAAALNSEELFQANTVSGTSTNYSTTVDSDAVAASYSIEVQSLAQGQKLASSAFAEDETVGSGSITISVNDIDMELTFDGTETISDMKDMINDAIDNPGLFASIITDDDGQHLILTSKEVGIDNAISITASDDDGNNTDAAGLSAFVFSSSTVDDSGATAQVGSFSDTTDLVGDGTLTLDVDGTSFSTVTDGLTLEELRDQINTDAGTAGVSVTASIVTDGDGNQQLHLDAGTGSTLTVTAADSDGDDTDDSGISVFAFDPTTDAATKGGVDATSTSNMSETQAATDAVIVIDGSLTVTQSSNVFSDAIEGVTITATTVNEPGETNTITISQDTSKVGAALATFAAAYNTFLETTLSLGRVNVDSGIVGSLVGESLLRNLSSQVRDVLSETIDSTGGVNSLISLGMTTNDEGLLEVDETVMASVVADNFDEVKSLFVGDDSIMGKLSETLSGYTGGSGVIQSKIDSYKSSLDRFAIDREEFSEKMVALESRLLTQFNAMDLLVANLNSTGDYLTSALDNLPGVVSSS
jgi:flagellar hook-associated protein 2